MLVYHGVHVVFELKCLQLRKTSVLDINLVLKDTKIFKNQSLTGASLKLRSQQKLTIELRKSISEIMIIEMLHTNNFVCAYMENVK